MEDSTMLLSYISPSISRKAGGIYEIEKNLAVNVAANSNVRLHFFSLIDEYTEQDIFKNENINFEVYKHKGPNSFGYAPGLLNDLVNSETDILHLHSLWMYTSVVTLMWHKKSGNPYIISINGMLDNWARKNSNLKKSIASTLYESRNLQNASCIHVNSQKELDSVRQFGLTNPICIIPNGVSIPENDTKSAAPWSDRFQGESKVLLYLGRLHPKKGLPELLKAWPANNESGWKLIVAGWEENNHLSELKKIISERALEDDVCFPGPLYGDLKKAALQNADAFILPSHSEGMPMSVLEAWSYKLPVLMTPECNIPQGFENGAAVRIEPKSESIAAGLNTLFEMNGSKRRQIGENGYNLVKEQFTWGKIAEEMLAVYEWIIYDAAAPECINFN